MNANEREWSVGENRGTIRQFAFCAAAAVLILIARSMLAAVPGPSDLTAPRVLRSQSGQFIVRGMPMGPAPVPTVSTSQVSYIRVDPTLLAVSCERIKYHILSELEMPDQWKGIISVLVHPVQKFDEPIYVITEHFRDGWAYRVEMPDQVERARVVQAMVQVILKEIANRGARKRESELPPWLAEGLAAHLRATSLASLTLEPETWTLKQHQRRADPLQGVRAILNSRAPLSFNELCWPTDKQLAGEDGGVYRACSQFFIHELLRLKNGGARLGRLLQLLPQYYNWQTAFLRAYGEEFHTLLDIDKWWSLSVVHLTSRDMSFTFTPEESLQQLEEVLAVAAQVRFKPEDMPMAANITLQQALAEWPYARQVPVLNEKIQVLQSLRLRASEDVVDLVDKYRITLESYLYEHRASGEGPFGQQPLSNEKRLVKDTRSKLDKLDAQREALRAKPHPNTIARPSFRGPPVTVRAENPH